jgi:hypothetical protein
MAGLFLVWGLVSNWVVDDPVAFQRAGSVGVALAIVAIGLNRAIYQDWEDFSALSIHYKMRERISLLHNMIASGEDKMPIVHRGATSDFLFRAPVRPLYLPDRTSIKHFRFVFGLEIAWVGLATLQWGYGDLFTCWTLGKGWNAC